MNASRAVRTAAAERVTATREAFGPLGSASAFSWPVIATYLPIGVIAQVNVNVSAFGGPVGRWLLASAISMCALGASLLAARSLICRQGPPRPRVVVASYAAAGLVQSLTFGIAAILVGATEGLHPGFRLTGVLVHVPMVTCVGLAVARHDAHRRIVTELESRRTRLFALGDSLEAQLDRIQMELSSAVRASLGPALAALDVALARAAAGSDAIPALEALDDLVERRIRPLSHSLVNEAATSDEDAADTRPARVPLPPRFRIADGIWPGAAALALTLMSVAAAARLLGAVDLVLFLGMGGACVWGGLTLVRRAAGGREARPPIAVAAVAAIHALLALVTLQLIRLTGITTQPLLEIPATAAAGLIGASTTGAVLVEARRGASEAELATVSDTLQHAVTLVRRRQHLVRRRLAFVLHGSLQGALYAATIRISERPVLDAALVGGIQADLAGALEELDRPRSAGGSARTQTTLDEITAVWKGQRRVRVQLDPGIGDALRGDLDADEAVAEVVREAVNNAFRHGAANAVEVDLSTAAGNDPGGSVQGIAISVRDDGSGHSPESRPGLGSTLFDELCRSWRYESDTAGTTFRAVVALS